VNLPLVLEKDKVQLNNATLTTPQSRVIISGALDHLQSPHTSARLNANLALDEVRRAVGPVLPLHTGPNLPQFLSAEVVVDADKNRVQVTSARVGVGQSHIEASGTLKDVSNRAGNLQFNASLALGELGRLLRVSAHPSGAVSARGNARLGGGSDYEVNAKVDARGVSIQQGAQRLSAINLDADIHARPDLIEAKGMRLSAMGGRFAGSASLVKMEQLRLSGNLSHLDVQQVARALAPGRMPYDAIVSGPISAEGNINKPAGFVAKARLAIAPGRRGIPVSGRLNAEYNGRADTVTIANSYLTLPNTRVDLSGALGKQLNVRLVSKNLSDFQPLVAPSTLPIVLNRGGSATLTSTITGTLSAPQIAGHLAVANFHAEDRQFDLLAADLRASPSGAAVSNGSLVRGPLQAQFAGTVGLDHWKPEQREPLTATLNIQNADVRDVLALAGQPSVALTGTLSASAQISGTIGSPRGNVTADIVNGTIEQDRFDHLMARATLSNQLIDVPTLEFTAGNARINANASYQYAANDIKRGALRAHVASNQVSLAQFRTLTSRRPGLGGTVQLNADATASVEPVGGSTEVTLTSLNGNVSARGLQMEGKNLGDLTASTQTSGTNLNYQVNSDFAGSTIRVNGQSQLTGDHATTATASIANLPIQQVLAVAGRRDIPVSGTLNTDANLSGTIKDPRANANVTIVKGVVEQEPFDRLQASFDYSSQLVDLRSLVVNAGPNRIEANGALQHPPGDFENGEVRFHLASNSLQLAQIQNLQLRKPGLAGALQLAADGAATLRRGATPLISTLNANVNASGMKLNGKSAGDFTATAVTRGRDVEFNLNSDFARAAIKGSGTMQLTGDYPVSAQLTFANLKYSGLEPWLESEARPGFDALAEGRATVSGPVARPEDLKGELQLSRLEVSSTPVAGHRQTRRAVMVHNDGPVVVSLDRSVVTIRSFHLADTYTDLRLTGTASLRAPEKLDLRADGKIHLELVEAFDADVFATGIVALNASIQGTLAQPAINGRLQLQNAGFNMMDAPNGLSNANGTILFSGDRAVIENLTGQSGGGQVTLAGFVAYGGPQMQFRVQATASRVHIQAPPGMSTAVNASLLLMGSSKRSLVSGNVTILDVAFFSHTDIGSMLSRTAEPVTTPQAETGLLGGMQFDIRIDTAPDVQFRTALAQNIQADAHLRLRGNIDRPGMLGRVDVTSGEIIFFGTKYTIDQGTVAFYNPQKIEPVLNVDLNTSAKGIDVVVSVSGPMDRLKLTYRSDPPMQFTDIVALLATGKVPTTDPVLATRQPAAPDQNLTQMGASAVLSQAVANPVSGRLQRLFGVSKLKIDPQIIGAENTPQARMTLEQQITKKLTFTYIQDVASTNPQIVRVQWDFDPAWTAVAERQSNGALGLNFFYKRRFR
jgi:translocation and assembly module TamB